MMFRYGLDQINVDIALQIARGQVKAGLTDEAKGQIQNSEQVVKDIVASNQAVYGINTGFGALCTSKIAANDVSALQEKLLKSHSVGMGKPIHPEIAKLMLILKVHSLAQGYSGISLRSVERIVYFIDNDLIPLVPEQGSLGASGDLAPLAHLFLPLIGLGKLCLYNSKEGMNISSDFLRSDCTRAYSFIDTKEVLAKHKLEALSLGPKEGLALINGTQFIAAFAIEIVAKLHNCLEHADLIAAFSLEALRGSVKPFDERVHRLRPFAGAQLVAERMRRYLQGSEIMDSHATCNRVQDPYSLRCVAQVHGASRDAWQHLHEQLLCEMNSVTDNPLIFAERDSIGNSTEAGSATTISAGNFHGQPMAMPLDYAALAAHELGSISDRRSYLLQEGREELPKFLIEDAGLNSGFMICQYLSASLVSENKTLCFPASADSIPTSCGQEDHVSMGSVAGRKALHIVDNLEKILAVELLCAAQAFDFRRPLKSSLVLEACHEMIRSRVAHAERDKIFSDEIEKIRELIASAKLLELAKYFEKLACYNES